MVTTVVGMLPDGVLYAVELDPDGTLDVPDHVRAAAPREGTPVQYPSNGQTVPFDPTDAGTWWAWLASRTTVTDVLGPSLSPPSSVDPRRIY